MRACLGSLAVMIGCLAGSTGWAGTIGYWRMEEKFGKKAFDSSGFGNTATLTNATFSKSVPSTTVPNAGLRDTRSVQLTGANSYLTVPYKPILSPTTAVTVEAWVRLDGTAGSFAANIAGRQYGTNNLDSYNLSTRNNNGSVFFEVTNSNGVSAAAELFTGLTMGQWTHLAGTYDGSEIRMYVNGVLSVTTPFSGPLGYAANNPVLIGADNEGGTLNPAFFFPGLIDEVRISDTALTPDQMLVSAPPMVTTPEPGSALLASLGLLGVLTMAAVGSCGGKAATKTAGGVCWRAPGPKTKKKIAQVGQNHARPLRLKGRSPSHGIQATSTGSALQLFSRAADQPPSTLPAQGLPGLPGR